MKHGNGYLDIYGIVYWLNVDKDLFVTGLSKSNTPSGQDTKFV
jgi:hypothetical protein